MTDEDLNVNVQNSILASEELGLISPGDMRYTDTIEFNIMDGVYSSHIYSIKIDKFNYTKSEPYNQIDDFNYRAVDKNMETEVILSENMLF